MINSRSLDDLLPEVKEKALLFLEQCNLELPVDKIIITSTYRSVDYQNYLYEQGRTRPGAIVTKVRGGFSVHNFRRAFDVVPQINGRAVYDTNTKELTQLWADIGAIGQECGLEWGGSWKGFVDMPHFQDMGGYTMAQLRAQHA
jgi:peptidoglycan L-alanyl-D-glutamate endopeptidase CwlK